MPHFKWLFVAFTFRALFFASQDSTSVPPPPVEGNQPLSSFKGLVVGIPKEFHCEGLHPSILEKWQRIADLFEQNGAKASN